MMTFSKKISLTKTGLLLAGLLVTSMGYAAKDNSSYPTGVLATNEHQIQILNTNKGTRYNVLDLQGNEIATELTQDELLAQLPELENLITTGTAKQTDVEAPTTEDILLDEPNEDPLQKELKEKIEVEPEG